MVALVMPVAVSSWMVALSTASVALVLPALLVLFAEPGDRPSLRRVLGACVAVLVLFGGCVLFAQDEAVMVNPCALLERDSWLWLVNLCWLY